MTLEQLGWNEQFALAAADGIEAGLRPGRIIRESRGHYGLIDETGQIDGSVSGTFRYLAVVPADYPVVGDWVLIRDDGGTIERVLPRRTVLARQAAGRRTEEQLIAANIDLVFVTMAIDGSRSFTSGGLERYLTQVWEGGAQPIIVLNKVDGCADPEDMIWTAEAAAPGVRVLATSAITGEGLNELSPAIAPGRTAVFVGPSGAGKSSLINALSGEGSQAVGAVRSGDSRGRHTTTRREFVQLDGGGMVIDTPGLREIGVWGSERGVEETFPEIMEIAADCRFSDCSHEGEPGCAVQAAVATGEIDHRRFEHFLELRRELRHAESRKSEQGRRELKQAEKNLAKWIRAHGKGKRG